MIFEVLEKIEIKSLDILQLSDLSNYLSMDLY